MLIEKSTNGKFVCSFENTEISKYRQSRISGSVDHKIAYNKKSRLRPKYIIPFHIGMEKENENNIK